MRRWPMLFLGLVLSGCVHTNVHRTDTAVRPPRPVEDVAVYAEAPARAYTVVAVVTAETDVVFKSHDDLRRALVARAAELGGDALILGTPSKESSFLLTGTAMVQMDERRLAGVVIVFGEADAP